jgi:hypothetical protein
MVSMMAVASVSNPTASPCIVWEPAEEGGGGGGSELDRMGGFVRGQGARLAQEREPL